MNLAILGYGKMGKAIEELAVAKGHVIVLKTSSLAELINYNKDEMVIDVAIEFSTPEAAYDNIKFCLENGIPVLSGTTGWLDRIKEIEDLARSKNGTFFYASNYSLGVNLFFRLNQRLAELMANGNYKAKIDEIHHTNKKDAPSGTAITLAEGIIEEGDQVSKWVNEPTDKDDELSIISLREENVPGTHIVTYQGDHDEISISHKAYSRDGFALGVLAVAEWVTGRVGVFGMDEFLGE